MKINITVLSLFLTLFCFYPAKAKPIVKKIAFIGRYEDLDGKSGSNEWYDTFVEKSLKSFMEDLNREYKGINLSLEVFNIHHDPAISDSVYRHVANNDDYLLVLDNSWGHDMLGALETIRENRIPVISINAYKGHNHYGPQCLYLIDYENDINYISAFAKKILERDSIDFISENDVVFHEHFLRSFEKFGLTPLSISTYKGQQNINQKDSIELFSELYQKLVASGKNEDRVIVYNSHFMWGNTIIDFLNKNLKNSVFMSWSVPQKEYIDGLKNGNRIILHHKSRFSVSERVYKSHRDLLKADPEYFTWDGSASLMEDFRNVVGIMKNYLNDKGDLKNVNQKSMADYLESLRTRITIGNNDIFVFNEEGKLRREKTFTVYNPGGEISYYNTQLNQDFEVIPSLNFGVNLKSIYDIDLNTNSFKADFEYWLTGDSINSNADKFIRIRNQHEEEGSSELLMEKYRNGKFIKRYIASGKFYASYIAESYPFDIQELKIEVELLNPTDELRMTIDPSTFQEKINDLKINGWKSFDYYVTVDNNIFKDFLSSDQSYAKNEVINIHFFTQRSFWGSILQIILPLFFIGAISIGILYVRSLNFSDLGEVIVGLFLSIVAFSISLAQMTPKFDALTKADQLFLLTFIIVFLIFLYLIIVNTKAGSRFVHSAGIIRIVLTILYPLGFLVIWFY